MDFEIQVTDVERVIIRSNVKDQGGNTIRELPPGATMVCQSSSPNVCNPLPLPGGVDFASDSVDLGDATITVTPGGTWDQSVLGAAFAPRTGHVVVVASQPVGFALSAESEDEAPPPPPATPAPTGS